MKRIFLGKYLKDALDNTNSILYRSQKGCELLTYCCKLDDNMFLPN